MWRRVWAYLFDAAADDVDLAVVRLGGKLQGLASERLDHVLAQVGDPERAAARHLELAHERVLREDGEQHEEDVHLPLAHRALGGVVAAVG